MSTTLQPVVAMSGDLNAVAAYADPVWEKRRNALVAVAGFCRTITSPAGAEQVSERLREVEEMLRQVEKDRKAVKAPILTIGTVIDQVASDFTRPLEDAKAKLKGFLNAYARKKAEEETEARRAAAAKAPKPAGPPKPGMAPMSSPKTLAAAVATVPQQSQVPKGTQKVLVVNVHDVHALYKAFPGLCNLDPRLADIRSAIQQNPTVELPGVSFRWDYDVRLH